MPTAVTDLDLSFAIPDDADGRVEVMTDSLKVAEIITKGGPDAWTEWSKEVTAAHNRQDRGEVGQQLLEQMELRFTEILESNGLGREGRLPFTADSIDRVFNQQARARAPHYNRAAPGAGLDQHFDHYGQFMQAIWAQELPQQSAGLGADRTADLARRMGASAQIQAAYSSHRGADGGHLIPESFRAEMLRLAMEESVTRGRATTIPMTAPKVSIPAMNESDRSGSLFGGVQMYWTEEDAPASESAAKFKVITLEPDTLTGYTSIPNETLMDAMATGALFQETFPRAMAFEEDFAFIQGNGAGQPLGWLNAACQVAITKETNQASSSVVWENIVKMYSRMLPSSLSRSVWVINQEVIPEMLTMGLVVGTGGAPIMVQNGTISPTLSMLGRPVLVTEKVNALGTKGDVNLVDLSFYLIGDLQAMSASSSTDFLFPNRKTAFLITERVDGQPWLESAVTPRKGTLTLSPFVTIEDRA